MKLSQDFYRRKNVVTVAKQLIGKELVTNINGKITSGIIVETEAYSWKEKGCHAFGGKMTKRNAAMFGEGGVAYVYLCYGMYELFNIVTNYEGVAEAVLIRAIEPKTGIEIMKKRRNGVAIKHLTSGPGKLTQALGINRDHNGISLLENDIWVGEGIKVSPSDIIKATRIGIDYAGKDADLLWRFYLRDTLWVSKK